jgi:predicted RNA binding protein YcfA (HicA-like mRNA interferase family)
VVQGYTKQVKAILRSHGWRMIRHGKGDHEVWAHPVAANPVVVDGKIMSRHTANAVLKQARVKEKL